MMGRGPVVQGKAWIARRRGALSQQLDQGWSESTGGGAEAPQRGPRDGRREGEGIGLRNSIAVPP